MLRETVYEIITETIPCRLEEEGVLFPYADIHYAAGTLGISKARLDAVLEELEESGRITLVRMMNIDPSLVIGIRLP